MITKLTTIALPEAIRISGPKAQYLLNLLRTGHAIPVPHGMTPDDFHVPLSATCSPLERCRWCLTRLQPVILNGSEFYDCNVDSDAAGNAFADLSSPHCCLAQPRSMSLATSEGGAE